MASNNLYLRGVLATIFGKKYVGRECIKDLKQEILGVIQYVPLSNREIIVLNFRLEDNASLDSIGKYFGGISRERVRQIEVRAGSKIKKYLLANGHKQIASIKINEN
jgi:DNA-directed RNA polymerase sigma subunit (sigma70/sigma32)